MHLEIWLSSTSTHRRPSSSKHPLQTEQIQTERITLLNKSAFNQMSSLGGAMIKLD